MSPFTVHNVPVPVQVQSLEADLSISRQQLVEQNMTIAEVNLQLEEARESVSFTRQAYQALASNSKGPSPPLPTIKARFPSLQTVVGEVAGVAVKRTALKNLRCSQHDVRPPPSYY